MEKGLLNSDELLIDVAMRGIGIQLPDEFVLRLVMLKKKADEKGLCNINLDDFTEIELHAKEQIEKRRHAKQVAEKAEKL